MKNKEVTSWQDEEASKRLRIISPILDEEMDPAKKSQIRAQIAETQQVSERTLYRYEAGWRRNGFILANEFNCRL